MTLVVRSRCWSLWGRGLRSLVSQRAKSGCHSGEPSREMAELWMRVGTSCFQSAANQLAQWAVFRIVVSEYGAFTGQSLAGKGRGVGPPGSAPPWNFRRDRLRDPTQGPVASGDH